MLAPSHIRCHFRADIGFDYYYVFSHYSRFRFLSRRRQISPILLNA
jgi:hypothetical protein